MLAGLYMSRSDMVFMVRQSSLHVWKVIVTNTPKTLREILPTLFNLLLGCLASANYDKRQVAARTLGDLVERVLTEIILILEKGLDSNDKDKRQGMCVGLSEIMNSTSWDMVLTFVDSLVPTVSYEYYFHQRPRHLTRFTWWWAPGPWMTFCPRCWSSSGTPTCMRTLKTV